MQHIQPFDDFLNESMSNRQIISKIKEFAKKENLKHVLIRGFNSSGSYYIVIDNLGWETAADFAHRATGLEFVHMTQSMTKPK
jgi:hypothetical protein